MNLTNKKNYKSHMNYYCGNFTILFYNICKLVN